MASTLNGHERVRQELQRLVAEAGGRVDPPRGYPHLGLALIDAVFSLRANYDTQVVPLINRYCKSVAELQADGARFDAVRGEHDIPALLRELPTDAEALRRLGNRQVAPGTTIPKAHVVRQLAMAFEDSHIPRRQDLIECANLSLVKQNALRVKGVGPAAWRYVLSLSGVETVKPDTMITRWVRRVLGDSSITPEAAALVLESAATGYGDGLTIRAADHLVWRTESSRLKGASR